MVLVGKAGQLGRAIEEVCGREFEMFGFDKNSLDVTDEKKVNSIISKIKPNIVINASAFHVVPLCEEKPLAAFLVNCVAVKNLAHVCSLLNIKFVTYSTDYVFDGKKGLPYKETDRPNPLQMYGLSKLSGEIASLNEYPNGTFVIRTCGVYGGKTGSKSKKGNFILTILREIKQKGSLEVSSEHFANPTFAIDLAKATLKLIKHDVESGIYHLASEGYCSWYEFAKKVLEYVKIKKRIVAVRRRENAGELKRPKFSVLANTKAKKLGIILPSWEEQLKAYIGGL